MRASEQAKLSVYLGRMRGGGCERLLAEAQKGRAGAQSQLQRDRLLTSKSEGAPGNQLSGIEISFCSHAAGSAPPLPVSCGCRRACSVGSLGIETRRRRLESPPHMYLRARVCPLSPVVVPLPFCVCASLASSGPCCSRPAGAARERLKLFRPQTHHTPHTPAGRHHERHDTVDRLTVL